MPHNFNESLAFSHSFENHPIWPKVYKKAFPTMVEMVSYKQDGFWQREGVDRGVLLENTKQIFIDEKVRGRNKKTGLVYDDILLEYKSSKEHDTPGWINKPLRADYIAYLIAPLGRAAILPVIQLQAAWNTYGSEWKLKHRCIESPNNGYTTLSVCVPPKVVFKAIRECLVIKFNSFEIDI